VAAASDQCTKHPRRPASIKRFAAVPGVTIRRMGLAEAWESAANRRFLIDTAPIRIGRKSLKQKERRAV